MSIPDLLSLHRHPVNPWEALGLSPDADDTVVERAYRARSVRTADDLQRRKLKEAYELIRTERRRIRFRLLAPAGLEKPEELLYLVKAKPRYAGPGLWLKAIKALAAEREKGYEGDHDEAI